MADLAFSKAAAKFSQYLASMESTYCTLQVGCHKETDSLSQGNRQLVTRKQIACHKETDGLSQGTDSLSQRTDSVHLVVYQANHLDFIGFKDITICDNLYT